MMKVVLCGAVQTTGPGRRRTFLFRAFERFVIVLIGGLSVDNNNNEQPTAAAKASIDGAESLVTATNHDTLHKMPWQ